MDVLKVMENITGKMRVYIKVNLKMGCAMVKVYGKTEKEIMLTNLKENFKIIKKVVMEFSHGLQAMCIKVNTMTI